MKCITTAELAQAVRGRLLWGNGESGIRNISLDSRTMKGSDLFVPIVGKRVDAHDFICQAFGNGASAAFTCRHHSQEDVRSAISRQCGEDAGMRSRAEAGIWIEVEDTRVALLEAGKYARRENPLPLVGITGSVGKTTTREMIAAALGAGFRVYKTPGNSNSQVGVPITIWEIPPEAQIGVIELGMSEPGEMERIAKVACVDCGVITNIGVTHIEQLGSQERILEEKLHIQDGMAEDGVLFLNGDDPMLKEVIPQGGRRGILYGMGENCHYRGTNLHLEGGFPVFTVVHEGESAGVRLGVMGSHMVSNALAALAVSREYGIPLRAAAGKLEGFQGFKGRQQIFRLGTLTVIDDSYNASPVSMKAGLEVLSSMEGAGRKIAVLADMKELGADAPLFHREIGAYIAAHPVDQVVLLGELAGSIGEELSYLAPSVSVTACRELEEVEQWLEQHLEQGDFVLFKGSNSMKLSQAVRRLRNSMKKE